MAKKLGLSIDRIQINLGSMAKLAIQKVAHDCPRRYPELARYTEQWKKSLDHTTIVCGGKTLATAADTEAYKQCLLGKAEGEGHKCRHIPHTRGMNYHFPYGVKHEFPRDVSARLTEGMDMRRPFIDQGRVVIGISESDLIDLANDKHESDLSILVHEVFHSTQANNLEDHNEVQQKYIPDGAALHGQKFAWCDVNVTMDRVLALTSLCLGRAMHGSIISELPELLYHTDNHCGRKRACLDLFTGQEKAGASSLSKGMEEGQARSLCSRLIFEGSCQAFFRQSEGERYFRTLSPLKEKAEAVIARFRERVLPDSPNQIKGPFMSALFDSKGEEEEMAKTRACDSSCTDLKKTVIGLSPLTWPKRIGSGCLLTRAKMTAGQLPFKRHDHQSPKTCFRGARLPSLVPKQGGPERQAKGHTAQDVPKGPRAGLHIHDWSDDVPGCPRINGAKALFGTERIPIPGVLRSNLVLAKLLGEEEVRAYDQALADSIPFHRVSTVSQPRLLRALTNIIWIWSGP